MSLNILGTLRQLASPMEIEILRLKGQLRHSGRLVSATYFGSGVNYAFLSGLFFDTLDRQCLRRINVANPYAPSAMRKLAAGDLLMSDLPPAWSYLSPLAPQIRIPAWIRQEVPVLDVALPHGRLFKRSVEREVARHVRQKSYTVDFTNDSTAFDHFYTALYAPYIQSRFQDQAVVVSKEQFQAHCEGKTLARLHSAGTWVAGMLLESRGHALRFGWFGCIADPPPAGASEVLDAFCIHYAKDNEFHRVVLGNSRPSLADGVLRYKAKFGAQICPTLVPQSQLCMEVRSWSDDIAATLQANALLTHRNGRCHVYRIGSSSDWPRVRLEPLVGDAQ